MVNVKRRPGRKRKAPVTLPSFPSPERVAHATRAGLKVVEEVVEDDGSPEIPVRRARVESLSRTLRKRGVLDESEVEAVKELTELYAKSCGRPSQYGYGSRYSGGSDGDAPQERAVMAANRRHEVRSKIPEWLWPVLDILEQEAFRDVSVSEIQAVYFPALSAKQARVKINMLLQLTCRLLCDAFGKPHAWSRST